MFKYIVSVTDGDFGWSSSFADPDEALRCAAASLYHYESPSVIRCDDTGNIKVLSPAEIPATLSLEEALAELDAFYAVASDGWVEANLVPNRRETGIWMVPCPQRVSRKLSYYAHLSAAAHHGSPFLDTRSAVDAHLTLLAREGGFAPSCVVQMSYELPF